MKQHRWKTRKAGWSAVIGAVALAVAAGTTVAATSQSSSQSSDTPKREAFSPAGINEQLAKTKAALAKYESVDVAKADGYAAASPCESTPTSADASWWGGAMGVHFVNPGLLKPGPIDPAKPPILLYLPTTGGGYELLGAEYFKPDADQNLATDDDRPTLFGRAFDGPMAGHAPGMPKHFDLHVWLYKHNPSGMFAPYNPDVTCP